ncbi:MAG TPA: carboxypeptidase-like regulatory domain-containing protein [Rubrivivax sp.]|nr:carboxypeptidase-like regulatory domain-containing protein [Rubrivivax sp.]
MKTSKRLLSLTPAALMVLALNANGAIERGTVEGGVPYVMGGIGLSEREQLQAQSKHYNLWVSTAASSGVYLANVDVRVIDETGRVVLQGTMNGSWLFAALPPGRYNVQATAPESGQTLTRAISVSNAALQRALLHFDVEQTTAGASSAGGR